MHSKRLKFDMNIGYNPAYNLSEEFWCTLKIAIYGQSWRRKKNGSFRQLKMQKNNKLK